MESAKELEILNVLSEFEVPTIPKQTRFWMIRTKRGYFYNEFLSRRFVALAWNNITSETDFSENSRESLKDSILLEFEDIHRPSTVINKCHAFIHEIKEGDILVIPSAKSAYVTFASAGAYYEDDTKTVEIEHTVIKRIEEHDIDINDVSCPYKKRRHISLLRTVKNEDLNYSLCRAISSYHGLNNLDSYARQILNSLFNYYVFNNDMSFVYNVRKTEPITPRELNSILYGTTETLAKIAPENCLSTQLSLNSPGEIVFNLSDVLNFLSNNWQFIFGLLVFFGGGSALTFKVPGIIDVIKSILNAPLEYRAKKSDIEQKELEVLEKKLELYNKIKESGIDPDSLQQNLDAVLKGSAAMKVSPIVLGDEAATSPVTEVVMPESLETEEV